MCVGLLANHLFSFNFVFLSDDLPAVAEIAACTADMYTATSRFYSSAIDGRTAARFE
jgi:hypothetical protein